MAFNFEEMEKRDATFKRLGFVPMWPNAGKSAMGSLFVTLAETGKVGATAAEMSKALGMGEAAEGKKAEPILDLAATEEALAKMAKCSLVIVKDGRYFIRGNPTKTTWEAWKSLGTTGKPKSGRKAAIEQLVADGVLPKELKKAGEIIDALVAVVVALRTPKAKAAEVTKTK